MEPTRSLLLNKGSRVGQERAQGHVCTQCPLAKARVIPGILFQLTHPRAMYFPLKWAALFPEASTALSAGEPAEGVTRRQRSRKGGLRGRVAGDLPPVGRGFALQCPGAQPCGKRAISIQVVTPAQDASAGGPQNQSQNQRRPQ